MKNKITLFIILTTMLVYATKIIPTPLDELVNESDFILVGKVVDVRMFNKSTEVTDTLETEITKLVIPFFLISP